MVVDRSVSSKVLLRLVISILTIISLEDGVPTVSLPYGNCKYGEFGNVMIGHPSWDDTERCSRDKPLLKLQPFGKYLVDNESQSFTLISELERKGNACFVPPPNSDVPTIELLSFLKSHEEPSYLAFLRDCTSLPTVDDNPHPDSTCPTIGASSSYVALMGRHEDLHPNQSACKSPVIVSVELARDDREKIDNDDYEKRLKHGIALKWDLTSWESCVKCKISGGKCRGRDGLFSCFCSDEKKICVHLQKR